MTDIGNERRDYAAGILRRRDLPEDPLALFGDWLNEAVEAGLTDATAMALATASADGEPSVRVVLLKEHGPAGFVWYTDYGSRKGQELSENPRASAVLYWREFSRQIRVSGTVTRTTEAESRTYFDSRPEESRFSAAASDQSQPVADRAMLEARVSDLKSRYPDGRVPMPEGWGGYRLSVESMEFWQGREGRLHDRFRYERTRDGWTVQRLQP